LRRRRPHSVFIIFIIFILYNLPATFTEAVEIVRLDQAKVRLSIPPGSSKTGSIKVENPSPDLKNIRIYSEDWVYLPAGDGTKNFKPAGTTALSAVPWISFAPSEFKIPAYGRQVLNYTVRVPSSARGGHYAVLFFEDYLGNEKVASEGVSINLAVRVASLFYIEPEGTINRTSQIDNLKITKKENKLYFTVKFTNTGNVDITTEGTFFIINQKGMVYARGKFNNIYTLPGDSANLVSTWKGLIPKGKYDLVLSIDIGKGLEETGLGRGPVITKEAEIELDENGEVIGLGELK